MSFLKHLIFKGMISAYRGTLPFNGLIILTLSIKYRSFINGCTVSLLNQTRSMGGNLIRSAALLGKRQATKVKLS